MDTVARGEGGMIWKNSTETYTLSCVKKPVLYDNLEGWDGKVGGRGLQEIGSEVKC